MSVTHQNLLDAMDGIAMILDHELRITEVGEPNWQQTLDDTPPPRAEEPSPSSQSVIGRPVTHFFVGDLVRSTFAELFNRVLNGVRPVVQIDYRCDAPTVRREIRLSVRPIMTAGKINHLLYQSLTLSAQQRPAIPLFGAPVANLDAGDILTLCAICARVAWPVGAPTGAREWIEPPEFYRRGGGDVQVISHGLCKTCHTKLLEED